MHAMVQEMDFQSGLSHLKVNQLSDGKLATKVKVMSCLRTMSTRRNISFNLRHILLNVVDSDLHVVGILLDIVERRVHLLQLVLQL